MSLNKKIISSFLFLLLIINYITFAVSLTLNGFLGPAAPATADYNTAANWVSGTIPKRSDGFQNIIGITFTTNNVSSPRTQSCTNFNSPAYGDFLQVGSSDVKNNIFNSTYGVNVNILSIVATSKAFINILQDPNLNSLNKANYYCDTTKIQVEGYLGISNYFASNASFLLNGGVAAVTNSKFSSYWIQSLSSQSLYKNSNLTILGLQGYDGSLLQFNDSTVLVNNNPIQGSSWFDNGTEVYFYNSTYTSYDIFNIYNNSEMFFFNSKSNFYFDNDGTNYIGLQIKNSSLYSSGSKFFSSKYIGNFDSEIIFINSEGTISNDFNLFNKSILYAEKSSVVFNNILQVFDDTWLSVQEKSNVTILGQVAIADIGQVLVNDSTFIVYNKSPNPNNKFYFSLIDQGEFICLNSNIKLESFLLAGDESKVYIESSTLYINSSAQLSEYNTFKANLTTMTLDGNLTIWDDSSLSLIGKSSLTVLGYLSFYDRSFMTVRDSNVNINGYVLDNTSIKKKYYFAIINSNFNVNGFFTTYGQLLITNQTVFNVYNRTLIQGYLNIANNSQFHIQGNFINNGIVEMEDSKGFIENGKLQINDNSVFTLTNSVITLKNGNLALSSKANITLINSQLLNEDGALTFDGDIYINSNSNLQNSAHFILNSNIIPSESGSQTFNNSGTLDITERNTSTSIMVAMINAGTVNLGKSAFILSYSQTNGSLVLNNGILNSNNTISITNSGVQGNGQLNGSISSSNAQLGNNSITTLEINGELESHGDTFTFTIESNTTSTIINVGKNATINNSTLVVRINQDLLSDPNQMNTTLIQSNNINGNGFSNVIFKSYDPSTNTETTLDSCQHSVSVSRGTLGVLLNSNNGGCSGGTSGGATSGGATSGGATSGGDDGNKTYFGNSLSGGAVAGIVVGIAGGVALVGAIIYFKNRLPKAEKLTYKLKQFAGAKQ